MSRRLFRVWVAVFALCACLFGARSDAMVGGVTLTGFVAGGDLSGSAFVQTVVGLQGHAVASTAPSAGNVLTWVGADSEWEPIPPAGGATSGMSWVDLAIAYPTSVSHTGAANTVGNAFWTTSMTATSAGGRIYLKYSGSGTDVVSITLWLTDTGTSLATATVSVTATGVYSFTWSGGTQTLSAYVIYTVSAYCPNGFTSLNAGSKTDTYNIFEVSPNGAPPWQGTVMAGRNCNYWQAGQSASGNAFPSGSGSASAYATVEATVSP